MPPATSSSASSRSASRRPGRSSGSIAGLIVHGLPDDELARYREGIEAVSADDVRTAARAHLHLERAGIVLVGDAEKIAADVEAAGIGSVEVVRDEAATPA